VSWCPFPLFRPLGLVIRYVVINTGLLFISLFVALYVKLDLGTHKGNAFNFSLKTGCDTSTWVDPHYFDVWQLAHHSNADAAEAGKY
jgi:hypothetical protein